MKKLVATAVALMAVMMGAFAGGGVADDEITIRADRNICC